MQGIEQNPKLGYYKVGDSVFYSKPQAYIYATTQGIDPTWHFNTKEFAKFDWSIEPETDIRELYRLRAQQLRVRYDYIRLECSGGGDSTTAAYAFLLNGIHLDEVIFRYPKSGEKGVTDDPFNTKPENTLSEWRYAAKPLLDWIKTNFPKTIVRVHDYSENMIESESTRDESWVFNTRDWFQPGHADKYNHFAIKEHRDLADTGKSICVLIGIDKPKVVVINDAWYTYFIDVQANSANPVIGDYTNITSEYFFWTPDFPEIVSKQSHLVKSWFDQSSNHHLKHLALFPIGSVAHRTAYENIIKPIIYPDYDQTTWQTAKPTNSFYNEMDHWFHTNFQGTRLYQTWEAGLDLLVDKINPTYFESELGRPVGLQRNLSPFYYLGPAVSNTVTPKLINKDYLTISKQPITVVQDRKIKKILV
jgi:hypothetical protein